MGRIVIHAGLPKTGSTSIQRWLEHEAGTLRARSGLELAVLRSRGPNGRGVRVVQWHGGSVNSGPPLTEYQKADRPETFMADFARQLDELARRAPTVLLTAEKFSSLLRRPDPGLAGALSSLARDHHVRIVLYVRPQHSAIEAAWKQYGCFDHTTTPSEYVKATSATLHYLRTLERLREVLPNVQTDVYAFVTAELRDGNVVADFASRVLQLDAVTTDASWFNPGLPLEVANLLRSAPPAMFDSSPAAQARLRRLKEHVTQWQWSPDEATLRSRQVLQRFCFEEHEADNQRLIEMLGWKIDHLVPPTPDDEDAIAEPSIAELDQLWNPRHSTAELQLLLTAVDAALAGSPLDNRPETVAGWRQVAFRVRRTAHRRHAGLGS